MSTNDLIEQARERLARTLKAADVITKMFMDSAPGEKADALLEAAVSMRADIHTQRDWIERMEKRSQE